MLIQVVSEAKKTYDAIDYSELTDDEAGEVGDQHELVGGILSMLEASFAEKFT